MINSNLAPLANTVEYLEMNLDAILKWKEHVKKKLIPGYKKMGWLVGCGSKLSTYNKLLLYK